MESGVGSGFPLWQKLAFAFGGLAALAFIGYLVDKPASDGENKKSRHGKRMPQFDGPPDDMLPSFGGQHATSNGGPSRHRAKSGETPKRSNLPLQDLMRLADQAQRFGDYNRAEEMYTLALNQLESVGADIFSISIVTYALSLCYRAKHELHSAEEYMLRALNMIEQVMSDPPQLNQAAAATLIDQYADILATLAEVYLDLDKYDECENYLMQSFQFVEKKADVIANAEVSGEEEEAAKLDETQKMAKQLAILNDNLTKLRFRQKRYEEAEIQGKKSIELLSQAFGATEVLTIQGKMRLAAIYQESKRFSEANELYDGIISDHESSSDNDFAKIASFLQFQAHQNFIKDLLPVAEKCLLRAISITEKQLDKNNDDDLIKAVYELQNDLITVYLNMDKISEAEKLKSDLKEKIKKSKISPPLPISRHLKTNTAAFSYDSPDKIENLKIIYALNLEISIARFDEKLPDTAMVVCTFENPVEGESPIIVEQPINPGQFTISVQTVPVLKTQQKCYDASVVIYKDVSKSEKLSSHYVIVRGPIDTTDIKDLEDLQTKLYEVTAQRRHV